LKIPIFLSLDYVAAGLSDDNLIQVLMQVIMHEGGFTKDLISKMFMTFDVDEVFVFQGTKSGVTKKFIDGWVPHSMGVHCMAHRTNFVVQIMSHL
jgi:hypothetical protein